jgi:hypothetical protein
MWAGLGHNQDLGFVLTPGQGPGSSGTKTHVSLETGRDGIRLSTSKSYPYIPSTGYRPQASRILVSEVTLRGSYILHLPHLVIHPWDMLLVVFR